MSYAHTTLKGASRESRFKLDGQSPQRRRRELARWCVCLSPPPPASPVFAHTNQSVPSRAASDRPCNTENFVISSLSLIARPRGSSSDCGRGR